MRKYPIGIQDFRKIREDGFLYVDKTHLIYQLINAGSYYFLSRPRRFGKSLLVSVIKEIVSGHKELFKGLWIENKWDWQIKYPVIQLSFASMGTVSLGLAPAIMEALAENATRLGVILEKTTFDQQFKELIRKASVIGKVVVLIDEYDKPIIDNLENIALAEENRTIFKTLYSIIKDSDPYIKFFFITGVSKFTQVSIFSDLNNLNDITLHPKYAALTGITQEELERDFAPEILDLQTKSPSILEEIKIWYNGYSWHDGALTVYNPFSLLRFLEAGIFRNFQFQTGTPTFLVSLIKNRREFNFENLAMGEISLGNFNLEHLDPVPLLFQTGYLTIKSYEPSSQTYHLDYPNKEVKSSLMDALLSAYREAPSNDSMALTGDLANFLQMNNIPKVMDLLNSVIASLQYDHRKANSESIFHIIFHLLFKKIGIDIKTEVHSSLGRCDVLIFTKQYIYGIELKLNSTAQVAIDQILHKGYLGPYQHDSRKKIALGINFSSEERKIKDYLMEMV
jgi:Predicted AAA-ATPase/PD-(D/E)XK nuclease superfamily